jgi:hypothetical protein
MDKIAMLEKCNRDVFMELDQSIVNRSNLMNMSGIDKTPVKTNHESPINFGQGVSALPAAKFNETTLEDIEQLVDPLKNPQKMDKDLDGAFSETVMIQQLKQQILVLSVEVESLRARNIELETEIQNKEDNLNNVVFRLRDYDKELCMV